MRIPTLASDPRRVSGRERRFSARGGMDACPYWRRCCVRADCGVYVHASRLVSLRCVGSHLHPPSERAATQRMRGPSQLHIPRGRRVDPVRWSASAGTQLPLGLMG